jgi:hypothetical protein
MKTNKFDLDNKASLMVVGYRAPGLRVGPEVEADVDNGDGLDVGVILVHHSGPLLAYLEWGFRFWIVLWSDTVASMKRARIY